MELERASYTLKTHKYVVEQLSSSNSRAVDVGKHNTQYTEDLKH